MQLRCLQLDRPRRLSWTQSAANWKPVSRPAASDMKTSPTLPGYDEVHLPGEQSHRKRLDRAENGVPLHDGLLKVLADLAEELDVGPLA